MKKIFIALLLLILAVLFIGCENQAGINSESKSETSEKNKLSELKDTVRTAVIDDFSGEVSATLDDNNKMPAFKGLALMRQNSIDTET